MIDESEQYLLGKIYSVPRVCSFNIVISQVSSGEEHAGFVSNSGHIYTMGSNVYGRLGIANRGIKNSSSPCLVESLSKYKIVKVSCGLGHTAALVGNYDFK